MEFFHRCHKWACVFLTFPFPVPLARGSRDVAEDWAFLLAVTLRITCKSGWVEHKQHVGGKVQTQIDRRNEKRTSCKRTRKKWRKKFLRHKNTQAGARRENAMFLWFTRKNIRNARSWKSSRKKLRMLRTWSHMATRKQSFQPRLIRWYGLNLELTQFSFLCHPRKRNRKSKSYNYGKLRELFFKTRHSRARGVEVTADLVGELAKNLCIFTTLIFLAKQECSKK